MATTKDIQHFAYIDSLRGIAVLMVLAVHSAQIVFHPGLYATFFSKGAYGVQLFFVVSSLTLFLSYEQRKVIDNKNTALYFFIRRFFRIAPTFYLATILYIVAFFVKNSILLGSSGSLHFLDMLPFILFLGAVFPASMFILPFGAWTVHVEMFFYFFIPYLFRKISTLKRSVMFFLVTFLMYTLLNFFFIKNMNSSQALYFLFLEQVPVFSVGIILFHIFKKSICFKKNMHLAFIVLFLYLCSIFLITNIFSFISEPILISIFFGGLTFLMSGVKVPILQNKVTSFFGKVSYSLYLWHFIIILFFWYLYKATSNFWDINSWIAFGVIYSSTAICGGLFSWVSYTYIEKPGINMGKRLILGYNKE